MTRQPRHRRRPVTARQPRASQLRRHQPHETRNAGKPGHLAGAHERRPGNRNQGSWTLRRWPRRGPRLKPPPMSTGRRSRTRAACSQGAASAPSKRFSARMATAATAAIRSSPRTIRGASYVRKRQSPARRDAPPTLPQVRDSRSRAGYRRRHRAPHSCIEAPMSSPLLSRWWRVATDRCQGMPLGGSLCSALSGHP
jgi:hypothetical protein